ncbi:hypothetical protein [Ruegeria sp. 6PALISEP08]|uniref:hypothetical protein n=1 Tax=Ruegeria sp. 6PALISEP08 TaxID=1225660 RepID=UPI00067EAA10|nr:hypothetical protein [Ruegeria sp. 6PALISEP08]
MSEADNQMEADRVLSLLEELRTRIRSQPDLPGDVELADEIVGVLDFFGGVGIEFPALKRTLREENERIHKKRAGGNAVSPEEIVLRAKVVASINHLIKAGANEDDARTDVAGFAGVDRAKAARWHKDNRDVEPPDFSNSGSEPVYLARIDYQIGKYNLELERKHNSITPLEAAADLFKP